MSDTRKTKVKTEDAAIEFFIRFLEQEKGIDPIEINDIRANRKDKKVNADIYVKENNTYYEIKSTEAKDRYWGRIMFTEIISALENDNYYFVILKKGGKNGFQFIYPKGTQNKPFMTLNEMLKFTNRKDSYGIDFVVKYKGKRGKDGELQLDTDTDHFTIEDMLRKQKIYEQLIKE